MRGMLEAMEQRVQLGLPISRDNVYMTLQNCRDLAAGRRLQALMIIAGYGTVTVLANHLMRVFASHGSLIEANLAFSVLNPPDVHSWHDILSAHTHLDECRHALELYRSMQQEGITPNQHIFLCVLKACAMVGDAQQGRLVHDQLVREGFTLDDIGNALVDMYAKCGSLQECCKVFDLLPRRDVVSWNTIIAGHVINEKGNMAVSLFERMLEQEVKPSKVTMSSVLRGCGYGGNATLIGRIHDCMVRCKFESDLVNGNTLIDMYAKYGRIQDAQRIFDKLPIHDIVSWGAVIAGCAHNGYAFDAVNLLKEMELKGVPPNKVTFLGALSASGRLQLVNQGRTLHDQVIKTGLEEDIEIGNAILDFYTKCYHLPDAVVLFDALPCKDVVSWGVIMDAFSNHGFDFFTFEHFEAMLLDGLEPDKAIYSSTLKSCGNVGALMHGMVIHDNVIRHGLAFEEQLGASLIEMYSRCGRLEEARNVFCGLQYQSGLLWCHLIAAYSENSNVSLARRSLVKMPCEDLCAPYVVSKAHSAVLSACKHSGQLEEGCLLLNSMVTMFNESPSIEHFSCIIDLLSRAGHLGDAEDLFMTMPMSPDTIGFMSLLCGCKSYGNVELGKLYFSQCVGMDTYLAARCMLMLNIYADNYMWKDAYKTHAFRLCSDAWNKPGKAWIETPVKLHEFSVGCQTHPQIQEICCKLERLAKLIRLEGCTPLLGLVLHQGVLGE